MQEFLKKVLSKKQNVNYLYFSSLFTALALLSLTHFFSWNIPLKGVRILFFIYALGQALLEVLIFVFIEGCLKIFAHRYLYWTFISFMFFLLLLQFSDFLMIRLMDTRIVFALKFLFGAKLTGLLAMNINIMMALLTILTFFLIPFLGIGFYFLTLKLTKKVQFFLSLKQASILVFSTSLSLILIDLFAYPFMPKKIHRQFEKILPFGTTFIQPSPKFLYLKEPLPPFKEEKSLPPLKSLSKPLPNIYLFVIETFRKDFLSYAPHLARFAEENIQLKSTHSNSTSTHLSWFSIFHSNLPLHWNQIKKARHQGSRALQLFKNMGYEIDVYSSADLDLFGLDTLIFGKERILADKIIEHSKKRSLAPHERDLLTLQSFEQTKKKNGSLSIFFLDSTHSEYSFPKSFEKYTPISSNLDYLSLNKESEDLNLLQNRYRNAICYIDSLMIRFFNHLKKENLYEDAIIAITGDHGEEFFEEGALFHGTHLNDFQTSVPIILKLPPNGQKPTHEKMTHIDIFPTILHALSSDLRVDEIFDGKSIFSPNHSNTRIALLQNGSFDPEILFLETNEIKTTAKIITSNKLEILELQGLEEDGMVFPFLN